MQKVVILNFIFITTEYTFLFVDIWAKDK